MSLSQDSTPKRRWRAPPPPVEMHCTIVAKVKEFSRITPVTMDDPKLQEKLIQYDASNPDFENHYAVQVHPYKSERKLFSSHREEYVSVVFYKGYSWGIDNVYSARKVELSAVVAIIDADGNRRFSQSKATCYDSAPRETGSVWTSPNLHFDHYVDRSVLLGEPSEWLPNDTLTLHIDAVLKQTHYHPLDHDFQRKQYPAGRGEWQLQLDSPLAKRLAEASGYFGHLQVTPMSEKSSGSVRIPDEEYECFRSISRLMLDGGPVTFESIDGIFDLYAVADKYCIAMAMDDCRCWLGLCLSAENATGISEFADQYNDDRLKEKVEAFLRRSTDEGGDDEGDGAGEEWILTRRDFTSVRGSTVGLEFKLRDEDEVESENKKGSYDFYN